MRCRMASAPPKSRAASCWRSASTASAARHSRVSGAKLYARVPATVASASWAPRSACSGSPWAIATRARDAYSSNMAVTSR
jgi:hypothetical protein